MGVGVCGVGLWGLVPETFWDKGLETFLERESTGEGGRGREVGGEKMEGSGEESSRRDGLGEMGISKQEGSRRSGETVEVFELVETANDPATTSTSAACSSSSETPGNQDVDKRATEHQATPPRRNDYTSRMASRPNGSFRTHLLPWHGRLREDERWLRVAARPFFLFAYPAILWSAITHSCCIGWLVVISESMDVIYRNPNSYHFGAFSTGLVYISAFIGGVLGTAITGKMLNVIVRAMARKNGGVFEPEFRLVMMMPVTITTVVGLMGFGWSAEVQDA